MNEKNCFLPEHSKELQIKALLVEGKGNIKRNTWVSFQFVYIFY